MKVKRFMLLALVFVYLCGAAAADVLYTTSDFNTGTGTLGAIDKDLNIKKELRTGLTSDTLIFSDNVNNRVVVVDRLYAGGSDKVTVYNPDDWAVVANESWSGAVNTYSMTVSSLAALNGKLYIAGNGTYAPEAAGAVFTASTSDYKLSREKYTPQTDGDYAAHGVKVAVLGENVYALFAVAGSVFPFTYGKSVLAKLDSNLVPVKNYQIGENASDMAHWNDGFAVAYLGGYQGVGAAGGIDFVDLATGKTTTLVNGAELNGGSLIPSVCRAGADTLYFIGQQYDESWASTITLYRLKAGDIRALGSVTTYGYSISVNYDAENDNVVMLAGDSIVLYKNSDGTKIANEFSGTTLGGGAYSVAILGGAANTYDNDNDNGDSGGGGCDVGGVSGLLALAIPAFLLATRKKSRA